MMALRIAIWQGLRISEVFQIQRGDVTTSGRPCFPSAAIRRDGKKHPEKWIKTNSDRVMPLHPVVAAEFTAYAAGPAADFVFGEFTFDNHSRTRALYVENEFPRFVRERSRSAARALV